MYEFFPLGEVCAIPPDATAFRSRGPQGNVVCLVSWDKEDEGVDVQHARSFTKELAGIVESAAQSVPKEFENEYYGNYGVSS